MLQTLGVFNFHDLNTLLNAVPLTDARYNALRAEVAHQQVNTPLVAAQQQQPLPQQQQQPQPGDDADDDASRSHHLGLR